MFDAPVLGARRPIAEKATPCSIQDHYKVPADAPLSASPRAGPSVEALSGSGIARSGSSKAERGLATSLPPPCSTLACLGPTDTEKPPKGPSRPCFAVASRIKGENRIS